MSNPQIAATEQFVQNRHITSTPASAYLRLTQIEKLDLGADKDLPKLQVDLVQSQQDKLWQFGKWGIVGLSPKGAFLDYLSSVYGTENDLSIAMKHTLTETDSDNDRMRFSIQTFVNPEKEKHYKDEDVIGSYPVGDEDFWYIDGGIALGDTQFKYSNQRMCLSSMGNELFGVIDSLVWCDQVKKMVCDNDTKNCTKAKADLTLAPVITINIPNTKLEFTHEDYIYFQDDDLQCRFGDICDQRAEGVCAPDTEVVLGKLFFTKQTPMFEVEALTGVRKITLLWNFKAPKERVLLWLIIGIIAAVVALIALIYIVVKKRKDVGEQNDDEYEEVPGETIEEVSEDVDEDLEVNTEAN